MHYHFLGIGGTAMGSVASAMKDRGCGVSGSDVAVYSPMSDFLASKGIAYSQQYAAGNVDEALRAGGGDAVFVIGNTVSRGNPEVEEVLNRKLPYTSMAALIGTEFIAGHTSLVVTGTHGKTTTTALAAWVLETAARKPGFLIGGVTGNFGEGCRAAGEDGAFVSEGDEYDTAFFDKRSKFVHYRPDVLIINNIEFDHADIFASLDDIERAFRQLVNLVPGNGILFVNGDDATALSAVAAAHCQVRTFGLGQDNDWRAEDLRAGPGGTTFHAVLRSDTSMFSHEFTIPLAGVFNVRNALGVVAAAAEMQVPMHDVQTAFSTFLGVKRRMEVVDEFDGITVIDDFAHHPTAVRETLAAVRERYLDRRIWALFEPRSNTTTRNIFQKELAVAFTMADIAVIGDVNRPERYRPDKILDIPLLLRDIEACGTRAMSIPHSDGMLEVLRTEMASGDVIVFLSNGSLGEAARNVRRKTLDERRKPRL